jgi:SAM-dependent methyltransferase
MSISDHVPAVRRQYEDLPYPPREPQDEMTRLITTWLDELPMINHYCFAGKQSFRDRFRVLVAGGGTGDATIFLAEQLRLTDAEVVHLDLSAASIEVARQRAQVRGLANIRFIHESLLGLPALGLGRFDYINCAGVLHHLADPDAGLRALLGALKDDGALGIMVYAQYGRTGVYQLQSLLRLINANEPDTQRKIANARAVLAGLPASNWFKRGEPDLYLDHINLGDSGLFDLLLHPQDRAYTIEEIYAWLCDAHGLNLELTDVGRGHAAYLPELMADPRQPRIGELARDLSTRQQHAIAELLSGNLIHHTFYAMRRPGTRAPYGDRDYVPFLFHEPVTGRDLAALVRRHHSAPFVINHSHTGVVVRIDPGKYGANILDHLDGSRTFGEIFAMVRQEISSSGSVPDDDQLFRDFQPLFDFLTAIDRLLLRHRSVTLPADARR